MALVVQKRLLQLLEICVFVGIRWEPQRARLKCPSAWSLGRIEKEFFISTKKGEGINGVNAARIRAIRDCGVQITRATLSSPSDSPCRSFAEAAINQWPSQRRSFRNMAKATPFHSSFTRFLPVLYLFAFLRRLA